MMPAAQTDLYMNMSQFNELKRSAREHDEAATKAAAQQFEGLFIQMMLKDMRKAAIMDPSQHSSYMDFYNDMHDKQISLMMARNGGLGIASMLQQQLEDMGVGRKQSAANEGNSLPEYRLPDISGQRLPLMAMDYQSANPAVKAHQLNTMTSPAFDGVAKTLQHFDHAETAKPGLVIEKVEPFHGWSKSTQFVSDLWPHAQKAAEQLGVSANVLVAQSALETGWGKHAMQNPDGSIAFNLFGIKAGSDWAGQSVRHNTLEFRNGAMQQEVAYFRAYPSVSASMQDYVEFVQGRARYSQALRHGGSDEAYIRGLQHAGYATDPKYADKILNIIAGDTFNSALARIESAPTLRAEA